MIDWAIEWFLDEQTLIGAILIYKRKDHELPIVTAQKGWRYHHLGIPTKDRRENEKYIPHLGMYVSGFETSPYGVEWMRFKPESPVNKLIQTVPHLAFVVDDLEKELEGKEVLSEISGFSKCVKVAIIGDAADQFDDAADQFDFVGSIS